jgi:enamine deaminase RidA (YjgF/YER057c/UK114 family)
MREGAVFWGFLVAGVGLLTAASDLLPFRIYNPDTMVKPTAAGYSQVAEVTHGKIVYIAGQVALDESGNLVGKDDFRAQVQQVFKNLNAAVVAAGGNFDSVVKLNYYLAANVDASQVASWSWQPRCGPSRTG